MCEPCAVVRMGAFDANVRGQSTGTASLLSFVLQARVETVIKVSQNRKDEDDEEQQPSSAEEAAAGTGAADAGAGVPATPGDVKPKEEKEKKKEKQKHRDHHSGEAEVDRIIDAQDNEYILSKPK